MNNILVAPYQDQTMLTRKKSLPYLAISYEYDNILDREYNQIDHFIYSVDDALTSFHVVDLSKGRKPSLVASVTDKWRITIDNTRLYSSVTNEKANKIFIYNGVSWKLGNVSHVTTNASIAVDLSSYHRGSLKYSETSKEPSVLVYPVYEVYLTPNALSNFKTTTYWQEDVITTTGNGGYMRSGIVSFISKFRA
jgi:hypothetical protein